MTVRLEFSLRLVAFRDHSDITVVGGSAQTVSADDNSGEQYVLRMHRMTSRYNRAPMHCETTCFLNHIKGLGGQ